MKLDQRLIDEGMKEYVLSRACGCAFIIRTGDQVAYCPEHQKERGTKVSVMRLTMIVHSVDGDELGGQDCVMQAVHLPDSIDPGTAGELMRRLTTHVDDELKAMEEEAHAITFNGDTDPETKT